MTENLLTMCCVCKKIKVDGGNWVGKEYSDYNSKIENAGEKISDDYCPICLKEFLEESKKRKLLLT